MRKLFLKTIILCLCFPVLLASGCACVQPQYHAGGPYYYKCWKGNRVPFCPSGEVDFEGAKFIEVNGYPYYEAYFNKDGYIESFKKYTNGKLDWEDKYFYENGFFKRREFKK